MNRDTTNNERNTDEDFPGYPHYPAKEDITKSRNNNGKINVSNDISIPELKDIPGQKNITPAPLDGIGDTTASSADEEDIVNGDSLDKGKDEDDIEIVMGTEADVTPEDLQMLGKIDEDMDLNEDEDPNARMGLDKTDDDGDPLNEGAGDGMSVTGDDLDVPGSEDDDADEATGNEDEENNYYSLDKNEDDTEGNP